jgi:uncharacterized protein (TIGR03118 family)
MNRFWMLAAIATVGITATSPVSAQTYVTPDNIYSTHNLVSNIPGLADVTDPNLLDPWGISFTASSPFWVSNHLGGTSTLYSGNGAITPLVVTIPAGRATSGPGRPTGQARFGTAFIFATEDGTISSWTSGAAAVIRVDNSAAGAVYKGLTVAGNLIYAANFKTGKIDVFNAAFQPTTVPGGFTDSSLAAGYAPFNIANLKGKLYVTYAKQDANKVNDVPGNGNGAINIFDYNGKLLQRFLTPAATSHNTALNSPWGIAIAPPDWGIFGDAVLVGNFGNGRISAFHPETGYFFSQLTDSTENALTIPGLWALAFGGDGSRSDPNVLYFVAGPTGTANRSLLGTIAPPADISYIYNSASGLVSSISPGEIVSIAGHGVGPQPAVSAALPKTGVLGTTLANTTVTFNGIAAPILYASGSQTSVIVPYGVAGSATANVVVTSGGKTTSPVFPVTIAPSSPGLFTSDTSGAGQALVINADGTVNSVTNPAVKGTQVTFYATGEGLTNPAGQDGLIAADATPRVPVLPVILTIANAQVPVIYAGSAGGSVSGLMKVQATIPANTPSGIAPVVLTVGLAPTQRNVFISIK